jgi:hypothetical protein
MGKNLPREGSKEALQDVSEDTKSLSQKEKHTSNETENHSETASNTKYNDQTEYPSGLNLYLIVASLYLAIFLIALVRITPSTFEHPNLTNSIGQNRHSQRHSQDH